MLKPVIWCACLFYPVLFQSSLSSLPVCVEHSSSTHCCYDLLVFFFFFFCSLLSMVSIPYLYAITHVTREKKNGKKGGNYNVYLRSGSIHSLQNLHHLMYCNAHDWLTLSNVCACVFRLCGLLNWIAGLYMVSMSMLHCHKNACCCCAVNILFSRLWCCCCCWFISQHFCINLNRDKKESSLDSTKKCTQFKKDNRRLLAYGIWKKITHTHK